MKNNKARIFAFLVITSAILFFIVIQLVLKVPVKSVVLETKFRRRFQTANNTVGGIQRLKTVVLVYTSFFSTGMVKTDGKCDLYQPKQQQCSLQWFEITHDKTRYPESDLVIFHARTMPTSDHLKSLLKSRPASQRWVYAMWESPKQTPNTAPLNGLFNLTWTYRSDSDFWAPYGRYKQHSQGDIKKNEIAPMKDYTRGKSKLVAWIVSNCLSKLRLSFVRELKKFIKVDVFGRCSRKFGQVRHCPPGKKKDCLRKYKFYLALENALCEDYITEKYWGNIGASAGNVIPIVMGGANYTKLAISGSYINVLDFRTVKQLAVYLQYLDKNNTAYNEYFTWRQKYKVWPYLSSICSICSRYDPFNPPERNTYHNLTAFWVTEGRCDQKDQFIRKMFSEH